MKIEKKFSFILITLIVVNIIYYIIAKNIQKHSLIKVDNNYSIHEDTSQAQVYLIKSNSYDKSKLKENFTNNTNMTTDEINTAFNNTETENNSLSDVSKNTNKSSFQNKDDDLVPQIGNNIKDGMNPDPFLNSKILLQEHQDYSYNSTIHTRSSHLKSFLIILAIISTISIISVAICEYNRQKRLNLLNVNICHNHAYYLLRD